MTYRSLGQAQYTPTLGAERLGPDRSRSAYPSDSRFWVVSATWAQRAVNAGRGRTGEKIFVDGRAGPITIAALRALGPGLPPTENSPTGTRITSRVLMPKALSDRLEQLPPVADPPRPRTSAPVATSSGAPGGAAISTDASAPNVIMDEGASQGALGDALPWVIGGAVAFTALGGFFIWRRRRMVSNRRRRVRRNYNYDTSHPDKYDDDGRARR